MSMRWRNKAKEEDGSGGEGRENGRNRGRGGEGRTGIWKEERGKRTKWKGVRALDDVLEGLTVHLYG